MTEKQEYRLALKKKRAAVPAEKRREWDIAIIKRIAASEIFKNAQELLLYAPIGTEINLLPLARAAQMQGKRIAFPRCDTATNTLRFYYLQPNARLCAGAYGIPEPPADAPLCQPTERSVCIVPALTFDLSGSRLGYGKGYYDRFLSQFPGIAIGAVYSSLLVRRVPTEPHDLPVSFVFTEIGVRKCRPAEPDLRNESHALGMPSVAVFPIDAVGRHLVTLVPVEHRDAVSLASTRMIPSAATPV